MKKTTIVLSAILLLTMSLQKIAAQQYYFYNDQYYDNPVVVELGASIAAMNCLTDIGGKKGIGKKFIKDLNIGYTQPAASLYLSAMYQNAVAVRFEATFGQIKSDDKILQKVKETTFGRYERNLSFRSNISDLMLAAEIHPLFIINNYGDTDPPRYSPYLLAGVGYFTFNPQANLNGRWVNLQPLSTEGQGFKEYPDRKPYKLQQVNIPVGAGIKYELTALLNLRAEFVYRILSTDYLDDVSSFNINPELYANYFTGAKLTNALLLHDRRYELDPTYVVAEGSERGNPKNNDSFFTFNLKIGYTFGRDKR